MFRHRELGNIARAHGIWGEEVAVECLRRSGYEIIERNVRPVKRDQRLEIDIIAYDRKADTMVFVEVKQHNRHSQWERRLRSIDKRKRILLRRACNVWRWKNAYHGDFRFDVIEVYGTPEGGRPEVDHIAKVNLFVDDGRFVNWDAEEEDAR